MALSRRQVGQGPVAGGPKELDRRLESRSATVSMRYLSPGRQDRGFEETVKEWVAFDPVLFELPPRAKFCIVDKREAVIENPSGKTSKNSSSRSMRQGGVL